MARRVVSDRLSGCAAKVRIEARLIADRPEELARVHNRGCNLLGGWPVGDFDQRRMLAPHHHRTGRIDRDNLCSLLDKRKQDLEAGLRMLSKRIEVPSLPCRHSTTLKTGGAPHIYFVLLEDIYGV